MEEKSQFMPIPQLKRLDSLRLTQCWTDNFGKIIAPEYQCAVEMCCVTRQLMTRAKYAHILQRLQDSLDQQDVGDETAFRECLTNLIITAYPDADNDGKNQSCLIWNMNIFSNVLMMYRGLDRRKKLLHLALLELSEAYDQGMMLALLANLAKAGSFCKGRMRYAFYDVLECLNRVWDSDNCDDSKDENDTPETEAENILWTFVERFIEDYKLKAFKSAFTEPMKLYHIAKGNLHEGGAGSAEIHAVNVTSGLTMATLGVRLSVVPFFDDEHYSSGLVEFLKCQYEPYMRCLEKLQSPENLGKSSSALPECRALRMTYNEGSVRSNFFFAEGSVPRIVINAALDSSQQYAERREELAKYLEMFMKYFRKDIFIPRIMNALNQNQQRQTQILFEKMKSDEDVEDYRLWIWDVISGEMNMERATELLQFIGIVKKNE